MDEARLLAVGSGERGEHAVDMALGARAALHGEAMRLVDHEDVAVLVQDQVAEERRVLSGGSCRLALGAAGAPCAASGGTRTAWPAATRSLVLARAPSSADLPRAQEFLQVPEGKIGKWVLNQRSSRMPSSSGAIDFTSTAPLNGRPPPRSLAELLPIVEPLPDLALEAALDRLVEGLGRPSASGK